MGMLGADEVRTWVRAAGVKRTGKGREKDGKRTGNVLKRRARVGGWLRDKPLASALLAVVSLLLLSACGGQSSATAGGAATATLAHVTPTVAATSTVAPITGSMPTQPAVAGGVVYFGSSAGFLYAVHASDGTLIWRRQLDQNVHAPAVDNGIIYVGTTGDKSLFGGGYVYALNATDGSTRWRFGPAAQLYNAPVIAGGKVLAGTYETYLYALRASDGTKAWTLSRGGCAMGDLAVDATALYLNTACGIFEADHLSDGSQLWHATWHGGGTPAVTSGLVYAGPCAVHASDGSPAWCLQADGDSLVPDAVGSGVVLIGTSQSLYALNASSGAQLWRESLRLAYESAPQIVGGIAYIVADDGMLYALRVSDGSQVWRASSAYGKYIQSPAVIDGVVYVGTNRGGMQAISVSDGSLLWRYTL
jgi:outer membrane protein assembly factor BamB